MVVDHASVMGSTCVAMQREFHGCFAHFLNLICKLFFDCVKKSKCNFFISPVMSEHEEESEKLNFLDQVKKSILEENLEENQTFCDLSKKISVVIKKIKKIVTTFNSSNNLSRDLRNVQKENPLTLSSDLPNNNKCKSVLNLIQDIVTR